MLQTKIITLLGIVTILIGFIINLIDVDIWASLTFMSLVGLGTYFGTMNVYCLVHGSCYFSSWIATATISLALASIAYFYIKFKTSGEKLPPLAEQPIAGLNPVLSKVNTITSQQLGLNVYELDTKFRQGL